MIVDPKKLPKCCLLDTSIWILALRNARDPQSLACRGFYEAMIEHKREMRMAAPTLALKEALGASAARELDPERSRRTAQGRLSDGLRGGQQPNLERSPSERLYPTCARQSRQPWHVGALRRAALAAA